MNNCSIKEISKMMVASSLPQIIAARSSNSNILAGKAVQLIANANIQLKN